MDLICFLPSKKHLSSLTADVLDELQAADHIETYKTFKNFCERLRRPKKLDTVIIICAEVRQDFEKLISYKDFLNNTRNILVLPDRQKATLEMALLLYPRFYIFADQDFKQITAVVNKIRRNFMEIKKPV